MLLTILIQILCDLVCFFVSLQCWRTEKEPHYKRFFLINAIAFFSLTLSDVYYNILFRVLHYDISQSIDLTTTITLFIFEFGQFYCWKLLSKNQNCKLMSYKNSPYIVFAVTMVITLNYYFITSSSLSLFEKTYQSISIFVDMFIWLYAIICLSRTRSLPIALLSLGCLTLVSSSLTICCLFLFDMSKIVSAEWLHVLWTFGTFLMAIGFILFLKEKNFSYCSENSIQVKSCSLLSTASIFVSLIGFSFIFLLHLTNGEAKGIQSMLWVFPIALVFTMIISVLFGNWFSKTIFLPINMYLKRIESFNLGQMEDKSTVYPYNTYEFDLLGKFIDDAFEKVSNALAQEVQIAAQVAHDMRSPLIAVDSFFQLIEKKLDEPEKVFGKRAVSRLNDIAWSLLSKYKKKDENHEIVEDNYVFLSSCIQEILAEKRMEYTKVSIEFELSADLDNIFNIVHLNAVNLKRALSNLINNAVNAIVPNKGLIKISLSHNMFGHLITIKDNGCGMKPEVLQSIMESAKNEKAKTNLGLPHAVKFFTSIGGKLDMESTIDEGTTVYVSLPNYERPAWCVKNYSICDDDLLLIIDDCQSVHDVWDEMLKKIPDVQYQHFYTPDDALAFFKATTHKHLVIFCDYEFFGADQNGVDILSHAPDGAVRFLVTSHLYNPKIMQSAIEQGFNILPKDLAPHFRLNKSLPKVLQDEVRLIFIDNEKGNTDDWKFFADHYQINIVTYNVVADFLKDTDRFSRHIPIYIDLDLGEAKNGIEYAKDIYALGFKTIYIATGAVDDRLNKEDYPWIIDIRDKKFPLS